MKWTKNQALAFWMNFCLWPGSGYFNIGKKTKGIIISLASGILLICALMIYYQALKHSVNSLVIQQELTPQIIHMLKDAWMHSYKNILLSIVSLIVLWVYSIVDVYIINQKRMDKQL